MAQEKWLVEEPKVIDLGIVRTLRVGLVRGQVDVIAHDEPTARVEIHGVSGRPIKVELDGDSLTVDHPQIRWDDPLGFLRSFQGAASADVSVLVPRDTALTLGVVSAGALVSGLTRGATLHTVSGDLVVDGVTGGLQANALSGDVTVRAHHGDVTVRTVSGAVAATGTVPAFAVDGVSGEVVLDLHGVPDRGRVNTVSGAVRIRLEDGVPFSCTAATATGRLRFDGEELRGVRGSVTKRSGALEGSWLDLRVASISGGISVVHAAPPAPVGAADGVGTDGVAGTGVGA